jgi:hypothetical protein
MYRKPHTWKRYSLSQVKVVGDVHQHRDSFGFRSPDDRGKIIILGDYSRGPAIPR